MNRLNALLSTLYTSQYEIYTETKQRRSGCLALTTGYGKTRISLCLGISHSRPALVICKKSEIGEWQNELDKLDKDGHTIKYSILRPEYVDDLTKWTVGSNEIVITNVQTLTKLYSQHNLRDALIDEQPVYGSLRPVRYWDTTRQPLLSITKGPESIFSIQWGYLLVDECQNYTNIRTKSCQALMAVSADHRWLLSGTPMEDPVPRRYLGYWCLIDQPNTPRSLVDTKAYVRGLPSKYNVRRDYEGTFQGLAKSQIIRLTNDNYIKPEVVTTRVAAKMTNPGKQIYAILRYLFTGTYEQLMKAEANDDSRKAKKFRGMILAIITYIRQSIVCPMIALTAIRLKSIQTIDPRVFCNQFISLYQQQVDKSYLESPESIISSRMSKANDIIQQHPNERIIVFGCFRKMFSLFETVINRDLYTINSSDDTPTRRNTVTDFSRSKNGVLLLTYAIGCSGLNLQSASVVIIMDYWWNSGFINQAKARIDRMGQLSKRIFIYYMVGETALEKMLLQKCQDKNKVYQELLEGCQKSDIRKIDIKDIYKVIKEEQSLDLIDKLYI